MQSTIIHYDKPGLADGMADPLGRGAQVASDQKLHEILQARGVTRQVPEHVGRLSVQDLVQLGEAFAELMKNKAASIKKNGNGYGPGPGSCCCCCCV